MGGEQRAVAEALRRLRAEQAGARHRLGDPRPLSLALERVGDGLRGDRAGVPLQRAEQRGDGARRQEGPRRVVHQHRVGRVGRQRFQPSPHARLPRRASGDRGQRGEAVEHRRDLRRRAGRDDGQQPRHQPLGQQRLRRMAQHRFRAQLKKLLGPGRAEARSLARGDKNGHDLHRRRS